MWVTGIGGGSSASIAGGGKIMGDGEDFGWELLCEGGEGVGRLSPILESGVMGTSRAGVGRRHGGGGAVCCVVVVRRHRGSWDEWWWFVIAGGRGVDCSIG
ncbi:hypothetical protein TIFTF001_010827 [Ficus carica]|uniref:Uncharacterized protein n=1 Tax=Ficus carica TaxID=3494 RepID=A0AA88D078_FICCA|nr:hypothetical protein TIFTF001_010827 [Ficus carica]